MKPVVDERSGVDSHESNKCTEIYGLRTYLVCAPAQLVGEVLKRTRTHQGEGTDSYNTIARYAALCVNGTKEGLWQGIAATHPVEQTARCKLGANRRSCISNQKCEIEQLKEKRAANQASNHGKGRFNLIAWETLISPDQLCCINLKRRE